MSGKLPSDISRWDPRGTIRTEIFGPNNTPTEVDDVHVMITVDDRNNLLASDITPEGHITSRVFIRPKSNYDPNEFGGIYPKDWTYRPPTAYSNLAEDPEEEDDEKDKDGKDKDKDKDKDKNPDDNKENNQNPDQNQNTNP